jgi:phosphinothricin acetyltransferase
MEYHFEEITQKDRKPIVDICNYYIEHSYAAYPSVKVGYDFFDMLLKLIKGYPAITIKTDSGRTVGFGFIRPANPADSFRGAAEISYFLLPEHTRKGIGKTILDYLVDEARKMNIYTILASISSLNEESINFHLKYGFTECGRFHKIGNKFGKEFDVVWMQMMV